MSLYAENGDELFLGAGDFPVTTHGHYIPLVH